MRRDFFWEMDGCWIEVGESEEFRGDGILWEEIL
jgi:hypothetical protein